MSTIKNKTIRREIRIVGETTYHYQETLGDSFLVVVLLGSAHSGTSPLKPLPDSAFGTPTPSRSAGVTSTVVYHFQFHAVGETSPN